ncbi:hypothetical protein [Rhizobium leguminosarum]|uniref:hypothetical protein n=1 Tax=Rhizobium leguminosarum TaxID=384 RepID=UPI001AE996CE|nr:hypothetical protein [Rhizobium leguminosarum]MBP2486376.1 hypothetical protein [Rhizobium leguminosarum]
MSEEGSHATARDPGVISQYASLKTLTLTSSGALGAAEDVEHDMTVVPALQKFGDATARCLS